MHAPEIRCVERALRPTADQGAAETAESLAALARVDAGEWMPPRGADEVGMTVGGDAKVCFRVVHR